MKKEDVHKNTLKNENELGVVLKLFSDGLTKKQVRTKLKLSKTNLSNYLRKLEILGNIKRTGKYEVKVISSSLTHHRVAINSINSKLNKRGHAHNFKILFPQETDDLRLKPLIQEFSKERIKALKFGSLRFSYKRFTIWINKSTLTVYSNNSYYSDDALMSKFTALKEVDNLVRYLKDKFKFRGIYGIEIFREHYGLIFNEFAKWTLERNEKMEIKDKGNKSIIWVDDSKEDDIGLKEFEGSNPLEVNNADNLFKSHVKTHWSETPEKNKIEHNQIFIEINKILEIQNNDRKLIENLPMVINKLEQQISSHLALINEYRKENKAWRKNEVKQIKENLNNGTQTTLF